jgi:glycopeptide antibiotics resistance protein
MCILPLPDPAEAAKGTSQMWNLVPFAFVSDFIKNSGFVLTDISTWVRALTSSIVYVAVFNILLTVPFGAYLAYYFKQSLKKVALFTFLLSLFFELTQLTGLYGVYARPYRLFDVDDLIQNTVGGLLGYCSLGLLRRLLPSKEQIDRSDARASARVSFIRRLVAFLIDEIPVMVFSVVFRLLTRTDAVIGNVVSLVAYFVIVPLVFGNTLGKRIVRIKVETTSRQKLLLRYLLRNIVIIALQVLNYFTNMLTDFQWAPLVAICVIFLLSAIDFLYAYTGGKRLWYERLTQSKHVSTF